jgi:hypothetical protein
MEAVVGRGVVHKNFGEKIAVTRGSPQELRCSGMDRWQVTPPTPYVQCIVELVEDIKLSQTSI